MFTSFPPRTSFLPWPQHLHVFVLSFGDAIQRLRRGFLSRRGFPQKCPKRGTKILIGSTDNPSRWAMSSNRKARRNCGLKDGKVVRKSPQKAPNENLQCVSNDNMGYATSRYIVNRNNKKLT